RLVATGHVNLPRGSPHAFGRGPVRIILCPARIMIFVAVLLVGLRDNAAGALLGRTLAQHPGVLRPRPFLKRRETEPRRRSVLMLVIDGMVGGQVMVDVAALEEGAHLA